MAPLATPPRLALILPAAGSSRRMGGGVRKPLVEVLGEPVICHTLRRFQGLTNLRQVIIVVHPEDLAVVRAGHWRAFQELGATNIVAGGTRRQDSVTCGLAAVHGDADVVLIHDAVRPLVPRSAIEESVRQAARYGAALVAMPVSDTLKHVRDEQSVSTVPREKLWAAQTPQTFRLDLIRRAVSAATQSGFQCTDDAQLVERLGVPVRVVRGSYENFKITTLEHLAMAEALLARPEV